MLQPLQARFGIGDIYFLSRHFGVIPKPVNPAEIHSVPAFRYYGKTEVVQGTIKKLSEKSIHLEDGTKVADVQARDVRAMVNTG